MQQTIVKSEYQLKSSVQQKKPVIFDRSNFTKEMKATRIMSKSKSCNRDVHNRLHKFNADFDKAMVSKAFGVEELCFRQAFDVM